MSTSYAQVQQTQHELMYKPSGEIQNKTKQVGAQKGNDLEVYWSEDFSNGPDGQGDNGAWTTDGPQGDLWFYTFPAEDPNGYDPDALLDGYGEFYPNYFGTREIVQSPTRDNGLMMIDADRWNSTSTTTDADPGPNTTSNPVDGKLISPVFDLSGYDFALVSWEQYVRLCCAAASSVSWDFSIDGGDTWIPYDVFGHTVQ